MAERWRPGECQRERCEQRHTDGDGQRAEEDSSDAGNGDQGKKHNDRRNGGANERNGDFAECALDRLQATLTGIPMERDVFHHHDGVVNHQPDGGCKTAERHQVEALVEYLERDKGDEDGRGNHQHGDDRGSPVAQKQHHDERSQDDSDENGVAHAVDGIDHQARLIVEGLEVNAGGQRLPNAFDFGVYFVGHGDGVAVRLAVDAQQYRPVFHLP